MASSEVYMLPRDTAESKRLEWQHWWMKAISYGNLLHQTIPVTPARAVADVATGTGAWIRDAASSWVSLGGKEHTEFVGFDISSAQFPQVNPPNLQFHVHDATQPFPQEYRDKFDIVNIRLVSYAIRVEDLQNLVQNIADILRPGGYLQWQECDAIDAWAKPESESSRAIIKAVVMERQARGLFPAIASPLIRAIEAQRAPISRGKLSPMTWTEQTLRITQLQTVSTATHPHPFVPQNTTAIILKTCLSLLQSGVARRKGLEVGNGLPSPQSPEDQFIAKVASELAARLEGSDRNVGSDTWDCEVTWIVARKSTVVGEDERWMSARYGAHL